MASTAHRVALRADLSQIVEIYNSTVSSGMVTADTEPITVESRTAWFEEHTPTFRPLWVIEAQGQIAAWLSFSSFYGCPVYSKTAELSVYVHWSFRRRGFGIYLLTQAVVALPGLGLNTLIGFIFAHNEPSLRLFREHGFSQWGELPRVAELDGVERDVVIVGRRVQND